MNVFLADEQAETLDLAWLRSLVDSVLVAERCPDGTEVSMMLVGDEEMARYNQRFMDRPGPTDVLSFPIEELSPGHPPTVKDGGPPPMLGDVILDPAQIRREADEMGSGFEAELALRVVHGVLHLLGYDHAEDDQAAVMEARERHVLEMASRSRR